MINNTNNKIFPVSNKPKANHSTPAPKVYFRGVNRVQVNRFKAYIAILANQLNCQWEVTQEINSSNVVVDWKTTDDEKRSLYMTILAGTANEHPPVIETFSLNFNERELVRQLNRASKKLLISGQAVEPSNTAASEIKVCGLLNQSLSEICNQLNNNTLNINFIPNVGMFSGKANIFNEKILLLIDPSYAESIRVFQLLAHKISLGDVIINELTVAIINGSTNQNSDEIFDLVYDNADANTHVTLINLEDKSELNSFVAYF